MTGVQMVFLTLSGCTDATYRTFYKPILFNEQREMLSLQYMKERYGIEKERATITPRMIVLHWTAIPTLESSFDAMNPVMLPGSREGIASASALNVSAHYLIDRDGTIFQQLPDTVFARHVIGLNHCAIGVENVGGGKDPLTRAQLKANEQLIRHLNRKYPIAFVIGHNEYRAFEQHELWKEKDEGYRTTKTDPGVSFMKKIRQQIRDLELAGPPD